MIQDLVLLKMLFIKYLNLFIQQKRMDVEWGLPFHDQSSKHMAGTLLLTQIPLIIVGYDSYCLLHNEINLEGKIMEAIVYVVDDDQAMVESLSWVIQSVGLTTRTYTRAQDFLDDYDPIQHGCLLLDVRMPGISGPELQTK